MITQCSISELYKTKDQAAIALAKTCERRRCGHVPDPVSGQQCLTACINISGENKHRYILATQDETLRRETRLLPGVPMVYIRRAVMIMEPPSPATLAKREALEREKLGGGSLGKRKRDESGEEKIQKKRKGPKEPNPLSVKKKKKVTDTQGAGEDDESEDRDDVNRRGAEGNVIGEVTRSTRRPKSARKRKHHKRSSELTEDAIPAAATEE